MIQVIKTKGHFDTNAKIMGYFDTKTKFRGILKFKITEKLAATNCGDNLTHMLKFKGHIDTNDKVHGEFMTFFLNLTQPKNALWMRISFIIECAPSLVPKSLNFFSMIKQKVFLLGFFKFN